MGQLQRDTSVCHSTRFLHLPWTRPGSDKGVRVLLSGRRPIHAVTPQQAARTWTGRGGWQGWQRAPDQQQGSADGYGVRMVSGHGVKWAIELGQGDTFHTHYCDMSSACKVRRGKSEVLVGGCRSKPAAAGLGPGSLQLSKAQWGLCTPKFSLDNPWDVESRSYPGISLLHSAGKHPGQEVPPQESGGLPSSSLQDHSRTHTAPPPRVDPVPAGTPVPSL